MIYTKARQAEASEKFNRIRMGLKKLEGFALIQGIYFLCKRNDLLYIGSSNNIIHRLGKHLENKSFDTVYCLNMGFEQFDTIREIEAGLIDFFKPPLNRGKDPSVKSRYKEMDFDWVMKTIKNYAPYADYSGHIIKKPRRTSKQELKFLLPVLEVLDLLEKAQ